MLASASDKTSFFISFNSTQFSAGKKALIRYQRAGITSFCPTKIKFGFGMLFRL